MTIPSVHIEQIRRELTWKLRHKVLYPDSSANTWGIPEDDEGTHFGAFYEGWIVGVVSLFNKGTDFQFRKLAIAPEQQGKGIGTQLLQYITQHAIDNGATRLWCNARTPATGFYMKEGFTITGDVFIKQDIEYIIMEKMLQQKTGG